MRIRFLLGPAGSGKTFRCLSEIRDALHVAPDGPPLILLAPKQATFQLERQLLADNSLAGYTRLRILSFERLARFIFDQLGRPMPRMLDEDGRLMVLRNLLSRKRDELKLFRGSARLSGFAAQLSVALRELQQGGFTPESLESLSAETKDAGGLSLKLQDMAMIYRAYLEWLKAHDVQDAHFLLTAATGALNPKTGGACGCDAPVAAVPVFRPNERSKIETSKSPDSTQILFGGLWLDGFAELSTQELEFLAAIAPRCETSTLAFCLDDEPKANVSWLSHWTGVRRTFEECRKRLEIIPGAGISVESLPRDPQKSRFATSRVLRHLEANWEGARPFAASPSVEEQSVPSSVPQDFREDEENGTRAASAPQSVRVVLCQNPEAEAVFAAREILRFVRAGGRFRDAAVIVRKLDSYHDTLERVFSKYDIPFFLDRRETMSHHPFAELTRSALRTVAFDWQREDWFAALKTGLVHADDADIDWLENEALARGWRGAAWLEPLQFPDPPEHAERLEIIRRRIVAPFQKLAIQLGARQGKPSGLELAEALEEFWGALDIQGQLEDWAAENVSGWNVRLPGSVHLTVWEQMTAWLENLKLAFAREAMSLRDWLQVLESGLANLTVGVIPPALDQVLIGAIDRSRNPDIKFALVLGMNEGVFPAPPETGGLLTETDRAELEKRNHFFSTSARRQLSRERYFTYIACTRARERLMLTCSKLDGRGKPLNTSVVLWQFRQLFPALEVEELPEGPDWREAEHASELIVPALEMFSARNNAEAQDLSSLPGIAPVIAAVTQFRNPVSAEAISPALAEKLYGRTLQTSVSRIEQFAACPFRFFVHSGLRAEERKQFELDAREQGSFQHDVLKLLHEQLRQENKRWRDITPAEARERVGGIARALTAGYRDGLMQASAQTRFMARILTESLQDFVETIVGWMRERYQFEPAAVELSFGEGGAVAPWLLDLGEGRKLALHGRIDRVDIGIDPAGGQTLAVVIDYKSSQKQLEPLLVANGIQLQLLAYLNVVTNLGLPVENTGRLIPAGAFYVNLRRKFERARNRADTLAGVENDRAFAYQHNGRFDARFLRVLDSRADARQGDQFNYRLKTDGNLHGSSREPMVPVEFDALLASVRSNLESMGRRIFAGEAGVDPYRKGSVTACDQCDYQSICRIDPWTHRFRALKSSA